MAARILHIILALGVFFSSAGFVVNTHYCQGELKTLSLFMHARNCQKDDSHRACSPTKDSCSKHDHEESNDCCNDESDYHKLDQDQQVQQSMQLELLKSPVLLGAIFVIFNITSPSWDTDSIEYLTYKAPIVLRDIPVLQQSFLL
jgi:hypothetical protein